MTEAQRRYMHARQRVEELMLNPTTELLEATADLVAMQQPEIDRLTLELEKATTAAESDRYRDDASRLRYPDTTGQ